MLIKLFALIAGVLRAGVSLLSFSRGSADAVQKDIQDLVAAVDSKIQGRSPSGIRSPGVLSKGTLDYISGRDRTLVPELRAFFKKENRASEVIGKGNELKQRLVRLV